MSLKCRLVNCALIVILWPLSVHGQVLFVEYGTSRGILPYSPAMGMGSGIAAADYDGDGDIDVFVPNGDGASDQLYVNQGNGQFQESAALVGLDSTENHRLALWFDYDGDQDLDLVVAGDCFAGGISSTQNCPSSVTTTIRLFEQSGTGIFSDVTTSANLQGLIITMDDQHLGGIAAGDINNDGYLDLILSVWRGVARLFLNNGDGTFTDISASSGVGIFGFFFQPMMYDFDGDGWLDIYVPWDGQPNLLYLNQHDNTFVNVANTAGVDNPWNGMGVSLGDCDNDGDLDIYVTNIHKPVLSEGIWWHNNLFRNESTASSLALSFTEVSEALGVDNTEWGWGNTFMDADNDGWLDLAVTNGFSVTGYDDDPSHFFMNSGSSPVSFVDVSDSVQFNDTYWGSCLIAFDSDRDGDLDMMQSCNAGAPLRLLENQQSGQAAANHYLVVRPRMNGTNHFAIGTVVRASAGGLNMMRLITAGTSFLGQEPAEAFFGLGSATVVDSIVVQWPDGTQTTLNNVSADQVLMVCNQTPLLSVGQFVSTVLGSVNDAFQSCMADLNLDGTVNGEDIAVYVEQTLGVGQ